MLQPGACVQPGKTLTLTCIQPSLSKCNANGSWLVACAERRFNQQSVPQTLWPELATWKLPCLKASIRRFWSVAPARKPKLWLMQFHAWQWSVQLNLHWAPHVKIKNKKGTDRSSNRAVTDWEQQRLSRQRCFTTVGQIIELHLQCYHCRLTFLWVCEIAHERLLPCNTMRHTWPIPWEERQRIKKQLFNIMQFGRERSHQSVAGWDCKNFKTPVTILR